MNERFVLTLLGFFRGVYERAGVDYAQMTEILRLKLIMDKRRVNRSLNPNEQSREKNYFLWNILTMMFMGVISATLMIYNFPAFLKINLFLIMVMTLMLSMFISDYSAVLLDLRGKNLFYARPIGQKTLSAAKMTHIVLYISAYALALCLPGIFFSAFRFGILFGLMLTGAVLFATVTTVFFSGTLYFLLLRTFSGERLKDILNYFQIGVTLFFILAYQIMPRLFLLDGLRYKERFWMFFLPSSWFSAPFAVVFEGKATLFMGLLSLTGLILPILLIFVYLGKIAPSFESCLERLSMSETAAESLSGFWNRLIRLSARGSQERAFMELILINTKRDRNFKLRILPQMVVASLFPLIMLANQMLRDWENFLQTLPQQPYYMALYGCGLITGGLYTYMTISDFSKGAWIYGALPISRRSDIYFASYKIAILQYILPVHLFIGGMFLLLYRGSVWMGILTVILNNIISFLWASVIRRSELPLAASLETAKSDSIIRLLLLMPVLGLMAGLHYFIVAIGKAEPLYMLLISASVLLLSWRWLIPKILEREDSVL
ncbi:MAG: hypothetical protein Q4A78_11240 [Peptostreptococcaceae bacterium]|nr:hypothetical protein [Peptostreptococcaceae bacterium]